MTHFFPKTFRYDTGFEALEVRNFEPMTHFFPKTFCYATSSEALEFIKI